MEKMFLMPGFRFHPTDVELVVFFLKRKVMGRRFPFEAISEIDLHNVAPWDLSGMSSLKSKDLVWFFFYSPSKKYATGRRTKRATNIGFWKTTGNDKPIYYNSRIVGMKKTLVFHRGKAPHGDRTDWVMYEYRLEDKELADASISQDAFVLCKIFEKSGRGPKNGEQYGAPFKEEDWDDDDDVEGNDSLMPIPLAVPSYPLTRSEDGQNGVMVSSALDSGNGHNSVSKPFLQQSVIPIVTEQHPSSVERDDIHTILLDATDEDNCTLIWNGSGIDEKVNSVVTNKSTAQGDDVNEIFKGLEDITGHVELNSIDKLDFPNHLEEENVMCQMFSGFSEGSYLELNDLRDPMEVEGSYLEFNDLWPLMEADGSEYGTSDLLFVHHGTVFPALEAGDRFRGNWERREPTCSSAALSPLNAEAGCIYAPQSVARGGFCEPQCNYNAVNPEI